jgi:hypothetical protein
MKMPSATTRRWLYRVGNAALGVAVVYGLANGEEAAAWGLLLNALLLMADANVPTTTKSLEK